MPSKVLRVSFLTERMEGASGQKLDFARISVFVVQKRLKIEDDKMRSCRDLAREVPTKMWETSDT